VTNEQCQLNAICYWNNYTSNTPHKVTVDSFSIHPEFLTYTNGNLSLMTTPTTVNLRTTVGMFNKVKLLSTEKNVLITH